jgi:ABC-2 type transport system permease protein
MSATASHRLPAWLRALPTMLRVGVAETVAYRVEFFVWMLTTTLPLVMLALWTSVASEAPFAGFGQRDFVAYYLAALLVRNLTGNWVAWQINEEVRTGVLSVRLLRPVHPFLAYATQHLAAVPLRSLVALPVTIGLLLSAGGELVVRDARLGLFALSLAGAWLLSFFLLLLIGTFSLFIERSVAVMDVYLGVFAVLSGYMLPVQLLPDWVERAAGATPFPYLLGVPVEILLGFHGAGACARLVAIQWLQAALVAGLALAVWRAGVRRHEAFGT